MTRPAGSTKRAATSRAQEIMLLQNRLALIRKLERMLQQRSTATSYPARHVPARPVDGAEHPAFAR